MTDPANRAVLDYDGTSGAILRWYAFGLGANDIVSQVNVALGTRTTPLPDIQGSIVATLDSGSGALTKIGYLTYGESPAGLPANFGYTGQQIDVETNGLYYFRARHYSPLLGRFMQVDPIGYRGGVHLYAYVGNDPLNLNDPHGLLADAPQADAGGAGLGNNNQPPVAAAAGGAGGGDDGGGENGAGRGASLPLPPPDEDPVPLVGGPAQGEIYYRTMSQADYMTLQATGQIPATGETFISPSLAYASQYQGVTVQFTVSSGTTTALLGIGVRSADLTQFPYGSLPLVQSGWTPNNAYFKSEDAVVNIGLGRGTALSLFNRNIISFGVAQ